MDPRKARDPRLARADPRLNHQQPPPAAPPVWDDTSVAAAQQVAPTTDVTNLQPKYKPRPLFCVVCASNQVCLLHPPPKTLRMFAEQINGGPLCALVSWFHLV